MLKLREWQKRASDKCLKWYSESGDKRFVINAAPGTGKTICAINIVQKLMNNNEIERVIVIAPMKSVVKQWAEKYRSITGKFMQQTTKLNEDEGVDICCTWQSVNQLLDGFQYICNNKKTMVICDEHHHAAVTAAWGTGANTAFANAKKVLILTGTPIRSDAQEPVWLSYKNGELSHPKDGQFTLTYGESIPEFCRPIAFGRKEADFYMYAQQGELLAKVSGKRTEVEKEIEGSELASSLQNADRFFSCAMSTSRKKDGTPDLKSFQASMLEEGILKLEDRRLELPQAGGLVIAPKIHIAEYMAEILELLTGKKPVLVHSKMDNAEEKIERFRNNLDDDWLVSVDMIGEGVDIQRLRVLVFLPYARTELKFRQAIGRVIRKYEGAAEDLSSAYCVMPAFDLFDQYADRILEEMPGEHLKKTSKTKKCPACETRNKLDAKECVSKTCDYIFPKAEPKMKVCDKCDGYNPLGAKVCQHCGEEFGIKFEILAKDIHRDGIKSMGETLTEEEAQEGEKVSRHVYNFITTDTDPVLMQILKMTPPEQRASILKKIQKMFEEKNEK